MASGSHIGQWSEEHSALGSRGSSAGQMRRSSSHGGGRRPRPAAYLALGPGSLTSSRPRSFLCKMERVLASTQMGSENWMRQSSWCMVCLISLINTSVHSPQLKLGGRRGLTSTGWGPGGPAAGRSEGRKGSFASVPFSQGCSSTCSSADWVKLHKI